MANILTATRLFLIIPVMWGLADPGAMTGLVLLFLIISAILTDYFDGIVARKTKSASARGQLFDHGTDFLFVTIGLASCAYVGVTNPYLPVIIVLAFTQYVLDSYYLFRQKDLKMSFLGRWNGIFYFAPLLIIALARLGLSQDFKEALELLAAFIAWALLMTTILSIIDRSISPLRHPEA